MTSPPLQPSPDTGWGRFGQPPPGATAPHPGQFAAHTPAHATALAPGKGGQPPRRATAASGLPSGFEGIVPLHPFGLGGALNGMMLGVKRNARPLFGLCALVLLPSLVLSLGLVALLSASPLGGSLQPNPADSSSDYSFGMAVTDVLLTGQGNVLMLAPLTLGAGLLATLLPLLTSRMVLGTPLTFASARAIAKPHVGRSIKVALVSGGFLLTTSLVAIVLGVALAFGVVAIFGQSSTATIVIILLLIAIFALGSMIFTIGINSMLGPIAGMENLGAWAALRRSFAFTLPVRNFWRITGPLLLLTAMFGVVGMIFSGIVTIPLALLATTGVSGPDLNLWANALQVIGSALTYILVSPFTSIFSSLIYVNLRMQRDGLDIALRRLKYGSGNPS
ncbi:hypothetical protein JT358_14450 [Micrococcales bacterium 31B]|nr:hypothetical protein [Micrococcales bacterium 31B]